MLFYGISSNKDRYRNVSCESLWYNEIGIGSFGIVGESNRIRTDPEYGYIQYLRTINPTNKYSMNKIFIII